LSLDKIILDPRDFNKLSIVFISLTRGKFLIITGLSNNRVAARIGKDAFFDPEIETLPFTLQGPSIRNLSITYFFILAT
jgi:hypothetical protein